MPRSRATKELATESTHMTRAPSYLKLNTFQDLLTFFSLPRTALKVALLPRMSFQLQGLYPFREMPEDVDIQGQESFLII